MYMNNGMYNAGIGMDVYGQSMQTQNPYGGNMMGMMNTQMQPQQQMVVHQNVPMRPPVDPRTFETPTITMNSETTHSPRFTVTSDNTVSNPITVDNMSDAEVEKKKKKKRTSSSEKVEGGNLPIIRADEKPESVKGDVVESPTIYTYQETNNLLHETLGQIDAVNAELVQEFNAVRHNRTMKNKYSTLNALSENIGAMLSNRISTIKEINNCISKANDMDYKKYKDIQAAQASMSDDKYIADLYKAFIQNPQSQAPTYQTPLLDQSIVGSSIIRANIPVGALGDTGGVIDEGYLNYVSNLTPEQNLMRYENNPNIKQVVVYDASTGNKFFQMMDMSTGEAIPNVPVYDDLIMQDTTLDLANGVAKNLNLRESFPIVQINNNVTSQY